MGPIALPSREKWPFLKESKNEIFHLVLHQFNFCAATEMLQCVHLDGLPK